APHGDARDTRDARRRCGSADAVRLARFVPARSPRRRGASECLAHAARRAIHLHRAETKLAPFALSGTPEPVSARRPPGHAYAGALQRLGARQLGATVL